MSYVSDAQVTELVEHFRLEAEDHGEYTLISVPDRQRRGRRKREKWARKKAIGQGSFGVVWLESRVDENTQIPAEVRAVKQVVKGFTSPQSFGINCARELYAMARLVRHSDYFADFFGWFETTDNVYFSMEYFPHGDLGICVKSPLAESEVQVIALQLLAGLEIVHQAGITHRDLKPSNVFVKNRDPWWVKIGDFGISKRIGQSTYLHTVTGTTHFMAPEIADGDSEEGYTNSVDLWSLGCVLYFILAMKVPFANKRSMELYVAGKESFPEAGLKEQRTSSIAIEFVQKLLAPQPGQRPTAELAAQSEWLNNLQEDLSASESVCEEPIACAPETGNDKLSDHTPDAGDEELNKTALTIIDDEPRNYTPYAFDKESSTHVHVTTQYESVDSTYPENSLKSKGHIEPPAYSIYSCACVFGPEAILSHAHDFFDNFQFVQACRLLQFLCLIHSSTNSPIGQSLLRQALRSEHRLAAYVCRLLLYMRTSPSTIDGSYVLPIEQAIRRRDWQKTCLLLDAGADHELRLMTSKLGWVGLACTWGHEAVLENMLLRRWTNIFLTPKDRGHHVELAVYDCSHISGSGYEREYSPHLFARSIDLNMKDLFGFAAIHYAAQLGNVQMLKHLIEYGADTELKTDDGWSAKNIAQQCGWFNIREIFDAHSKLGIWSVSSSASIAAACQDGRGGILGLLNKKSIFVTPKFYSSPPASDYGPYSDQRSESDRLRRSAHEDQYATTYDDTFGRSSDDNAELTFEYSDEDMPAEYIRYEPRPGDRVSRYYDDRGLDEFPIVSKPSSQNNDGGNNREHTIRRTDVNRPRRFEAEPEAYWNAEKKEVRRGKVRFTGADRVIPRRQGTGQLSDPENSGDSMIVQLPVTRDQYQSSRSILDKIIDKYERPAPKVASTHQKPEVPLRRRRTVDNETIQIRSNEPELQPRTDKKVSSQKKRLPR